MDNHWLLIGRLSAPFGVRGWLKLHSFTEPCERILDYAPWRLRLGRREWQAAPAEWNHHGKALVVRFDEVGDRDLARAWSGAEIGMDPRQLPDLEEGEYYWSELEGMEVVNQDGVSLGQVARMMETGANDVLVVEGERQRLIPFTLGHAVTRVDRPTRRIHVDWDKDF